MMRRSDMVRHVPGTCPGGIQQKVKTWLQSALTSSDLLHHHAQNDTPHARATQNGEDVIRRNNNDNNRKAYALNNELYEKKGVLLRLVSVVPAQATAQRDSDAVAQPEDDGATRRKRNREVWTCGGGFYVYNGVSQVLYY